ncbi:hypothetical protein [Hymenobacter psoromatis]|uniref:hypothetical protein n=1 Tax=Hymenobacter psoromatis TaxID=1484116 RepID=UPI001CBDF6EE|nr:hypothetical protein [Hymenobacter psoromatis]
MAKKNAAATVEAPAAKTKRTPQEKAERKSAKDGRRATKTLTDDRAEKKASQKQTLKSAAKQLQKELDARMSEIVSRIRKETKAKLKEVVKEATRRLDVDTERMFEQALHTIVRHYDSIAPGSPTPSAELNANGEATGDTPAKNSGLNKNGAPRKARKIKTTPEAAPTKRAARPTAAKTVAPTPATSRAGRGPGRPKRAASSAEIGTLDLSTPVATANDSVAVDNV